MAVIPSVKSFVVKVGGLLNQPLVKEGVKNIASVVTFIFGIVEIYAIYQSVKNRNITTETSTQKFSWPETIKKIVVVCAKISLILSGMVSRPGLFIISTLVGHFFTPLQLESVFGPNTIFAVNPWHPRHVASIAAVILVLPTLLQTLYQGGCWVYKKITQQAQPKEEASVEPPSERNWLTEIKMRLMVLFNTMTSRPVLHVGNQVFRKLV